MSRLTTFPLIESGLAVGAGVGVAVAIDEGGAVGIGVAPTGDGLEPIGVDVAGAFVVIGLVGFVGGAEPPPPPPLHPASAATIATETSSERVDVRRVMASNLRRGASGLDRCSPSVGLPYLIKSCYRIYLRLSKCHDTVAAC